MAVFDGQVKLPVRYSPPCARLKKKHIQCEKVLPYESVTFLINCLRTGIATPSATFISGKAAKTAI